MPTRPHSTRANPERRTQAIVEAIENFDIVDSPAWHDLDILSTHTHIDGIEVDPEGIIFEPEGRFKGVANIYVLLKYGSDKDEGFETTDSFRGYFQGHFEKGGKPIIENLSID